MSIQYVVGDVTQPICKPALIAHICNDIGAYGAGVSGAISDKWEIVEKEYRIWARQKDFNLGDIRVVQVERDVYVANMIGQHGIGIRNGIIPIRYDSVKLCLQKVALFSALKLSVHMPRIGCGLAGGSWDKIQEIIEDELVAHNIPVIVYDFKG